MSKVIKLLVEGSGMLINTFCESNLSYLPIWTIHMAHRVKQLLPHKMDNKTKGYRCVFGTFFGLDFTGFIERP